MTAANVLTVVTRLKEMRRLKVTPKVKVKLSQKVKVKLSQKVKVNLDSKMDNLYREYFRL